MDGEELLDAENRMLRMKLPGRRKKGTPKGRCMEVVREVMAGGESCGGGRGGLEELGTDNSLW